MSFSVAKSIKTLLTPSTVDVAASVVEADERHIQVTLEALLPVVLLRLIFNLQYKNKEGLRQMSRVAAGHEVSRHIASMLKGSAQHQGILNMVPIVLGDEQKPLAQLLAGYGGLSAEKVQQLFRAFVPVCLELIGTEVKHRKMDTAAFESFLRQLQSEVQALTPQACVAALDWKVPVQYKRKEPVRSSKKQQPVPLIKRLRLSYLLAGFSWMR